MGTTLPGGFLERQKRVPVDEKASLVTLMVLTWVGVGVGLALGAPINFAGVGFFAFTAVATGWTAALAVARWRLGLPPITVSHAAGMEGADNRPSYGTP